MLRSIRDLHGSTVSAVDGDIGSVVQAYLDDESWDVRYPVVETGSWLNERQVLISPYSVKHTDPGSDIVHVDISRQQVRDSPMLGTHKPVSRQHEIDYLRYYSYPAYWGGPKRWGMGAYPAYDPSGVAPGALLDEPTRPTLHRSTPPLDVHLRSTDEIKGLPPQNRRWRHRSCGGFYLRRRRLARFDCIDDLDARCHQTSPRYDDSTPIDRGHEVMLHQFYHKRGYWSLEETEEQVASQ